MNNSNDPPHPEAPLGGWERIAEELRACKETQRRAWGDVDSLVLGRYLAGEADDGEAARIENALEELPELRKLTDVVREVLGDLGPVAWDDVPLDAPAPRPAAQPVLLPFRPRARQPRRLGGWLRRRAPLVAAACLVIVFGAAMPGVSPLAGPVDSFPAPKDGFASREGSVSALASGTADPTRGAAPGLLPREPRQRDMPGLPPAVFDATKRSFLHLRHDGDLGRAAREAEKVANYCRHNLREDDPTRAYAVRQLADVYQTALNTEPAERPNPIALANSPSGSGTVRAAAGPAEQARFASARRLGHDLMTKPVHEVRATIVPVLTEALRRAPDAAGRRRLLQALARLGPAADEALPALTLYLARTTHAADAAEVLAVIDALGPGGMAALPVLAKLGEVAPAKKGPKGLGGRELNFHFKASPTERKRAAEMHARFEGRDGRVGVLDRAGCFSVRAARDATARLRDLARERGIEVLVETSPGAPGKTCDDQTKLSGNAVHVHLYLKGPAARVCIGANLKQVAVAVEGARVQALDCCKKKDLDRALSEIVAALVKAPGQGAQSR